MNLIHASSTFFNSDKFHFYLSGVDSKQNVRSWTDNNPKKLYEKPLYSPKMTVRCTISKFVVIGPYNSEKNRGTVIANAERFHVVKFFLNLNW